MGVRYVSMYRLFLVSIISLVALAAKAFPADSYAASSRLSTGRWVKVSVTSTGMHYIPAADLQRMGFKNPAAVRVYGYGAQRLPEVLSLATLADDLPATPVHCDGSGIYFYAVGPVTVAATNEGNLYPATNPYTVKGYYFITEEEGEAPALPQSPAVSATATPVTTFPALAYHKEELENPGQTGNEMMGEDFLANATRSFNITLPGVVAGSQASLECTFYTKNQSASRLVFSIDDNALPYVGTDAVRAEDGHYTHALKTVTLHPFAAAGERVKVTVNHSRSARGSLSRLGHLAVTYTRPLALDDGKLDFHLTAPSATLTGLAGGARVWDVTDPLNIKSLGDAAVGGELAVNSTSTAMRHYVAWNPGAKFPAPVNEGVVANQDLHAREVPDMVIFTHPDWKSQARRVAVLHSSSADALDVLVVEPQELYNEFSSGAPDALALRKLLKMFYDRSDPAAEHRLRYVLIMGRSSYDNRRLSQSVKALKYPLLPGWQTDTSLSDNTSYTTDDIYTMLLDGAGANPAADYQCIAVGRMPVVSLVDARNVVDKLEQYVNNPVNTPWKNKAIIVADDENEGWFMKHSDWLVDNAMATDGGKHVMYNKIYIDAYQQLNSTYPQARQDMFRMLNEGAALWTFAGHANPTSWTGDGLMTYTDINNLYIKHYPFVIAATCDFLRWDAREISAAEILYRTPSSGIIGAVSATRPAIISPNGDLLASIGRHIYRTDADGRYLTIGEIYRAAKNNSAGRGTWNNSNKLRYVLMGDPAMRLCTPSNRVVADMIGGVSTDGTESPVIKARQMVEVVGHVEDPSGNPIDEFDGTIQLTLYDAEHSTTSHGYGEQGLEYTFEQQGGRLHTSIHPVKEGKFTISIPMPGEVADNYRPAALDMYAVANDGNDAVGVERNLYVYGYDDTAGDDTTAPVIEFFHLNHAGADLNAVNTTPVVVARVSDDVAINLSGAGIGHQMTLTLDTRRSFTDLPLYFTPSADGTPSGTIVYTLPEVTPGHHELTLRVWDTSGNSTSATLEFNASSSQAPVLYDLYADCNPARTDTRFYLIHDRPNAVVTLQVEVFDLMGRQVWTTSVNGMSDPTLPLPVKWDLCDNAGRRVGRGIYLYRARVTDADGLTSSTATRRIAVTAP